MNYSESELNCAEHDELIAEAARVVPRLGPALFGAITHLAQAHHLTPAQVKIILQVGTHGQMAIGEIASSLTVSMPAVSEIVDRLVEAGHLVRTADPADRRRVLVAATPRSLQMLEELHELRRDQVRHALSLLAPEERSMFVRSLQAFLAGLSAVQNIPSADDSGQARSNSRSQPNASGEPKEHALSGVPAARSAALRPTSPRATPPSQGTQR